MPILKAIKNRLLGVTKTVDPTLRAQLLRRGMRGRLAELEGRQPVFRAQIGEGMAGFETSKHTPFERQKIKYKQVGLPKKKTVLSLSEQRKAQQGLAISPAERARQVVDRVIITQKLLQKLPSPEEAPQRIREVGKILARYPGRLAVSLAIEPTAAILNKRAEFKPTSKFEKTVFGEEPIRGFLTRETDLLKKGEQLALKTGINKKWAPALAAGVVPALMTGEMALDLLPFGQPEKVSAKIAATKDIDKIIEMAKTVYRATEEELRPLAKTLAKIDDAKQVEKIMQGVVKKETKPVELPASLKVKNKLAERILEGDWDEEIKTAVRESPDSYHEVLTDVDAKKLISDLSKDDLRETFYGDNGKVSIYAGERLARMLQAEGKINETFNVIKEAQKLSVKSGQMSQAQKIWVKWMQPESKIIEIENRLLKEGRVLTEKQKNHLLDLFKENKHLDDEVEKLKITAQATLKKSDIEAYKKALDAYDSHLLRTSKVLGLYVPRKISDTLVSIMSGNLLTIKSLIKNPLYNLFFMPAHLTTRGIAVMADRMLSVLSKGKRTKYFGSPIEAGKGFYEGFKKSLKSIKTGTTPELPKIDQTGSFKQAYRGFQPWRSLVSAISGKDLPVSAKTGKPLFYDRANRLIEGIFGWSPEAMFRSLDLGDRPFKEMQKRLLLSAESKKVGKKLIDATLTADEAKKAVFQQESKIVYVISKYLHQPTKWPAVNGLAKFFVRSNIPYLKIPFNVAKTTIEFVVPEISSARFLYYAARGKRQQALENLGKAAVGWMLRSTAKTLVKAGLVETRTYEGRKKQELKYKKIPPGHINISGLKRLLQGENPAYRNEDTTMNFATFGLLGAAIYMETGKPPERTGVKKAIGIPTDVLNSLFDIGSFVVDQSFLSGVHVLLNAITESRAQQGSYFVNNWIRNWFSAVSSIPLPNNLSAAVRVYDNFLRDTKTKDEVDTMENILRSRLFLTKALPPRLGLFGEKIERIRKAKLPKRIIEQFFDPFDIQTIQTNEVYYEMDKLMNQTGDPSVIPPLPARYYTKNGVRHDLTPDQYAIVAQRIGQIRLEKIRALLETKSYYKLTPEEQVDEWNNAYREGRKEALKELF